MEHRSEITGLRAVAVLPVILFHADFASFAGGFVGVDVFFVISGFLITGIILRELDEGRFSIARFYERRARRILPALAAVLAVCTGLAWLWMVPDRFEEYSRSLIAVSLFVSNIYFWRTADYFGPVAEQSLLLHTWSLAIEEQFYIFFPIGMILAFWLGRRWIAPLIVIGFAASLGLSIWFSPLYIDAAFYLLPTRAWELLAGSLCSVWLHHHARRPNDPLALLGLAMIALSVATFHDGMPFPSFYALLPVSGTALVILFGSNWGLAGRLLSARLAVGIGLVSYSAYLWHQPLFALARVRSMFEPSHVEMLALAALSLVLAAVTWRFVEQPFRHPNRPLFPRQTALFGASLATIAAFAVIGAAGLYGDGRNALWARVNPAEAGIYRLMAEEPRFSLDDDGACRFRLNPLNEPAFRERIEACFDRHGPTYLVVGDSHAADLFGALTSADGAAFIVGLIAGGCHPYSSMPWCPHEAIEEYLRERPEIFHTIFYNQTGNWLFRGWGRGLETDRALFDHIPLDAPVPYYEIGTRRLATVKAYLGRIAEATKRPVYWIGPRVEPHIPLEWIMRVGCTQPLALRENQHETFGRIDRAIAETLEGSGIGYISQIEHLAFDPAADIFDCQNLFWFDREHWTAAGEKRFGARLFPVLAPIIDAARPRAALR